MASSSSSSAAAAVDMVEIVENCMTCANCHEIVLPTKNFRICGNGHLLCAKCDDKGFCPKIVKPSGKPMMLNGEELTRTCCEPVSQQAIGFLTKLQAECEFKCPYAESGCQQILKGDKIGRHPENCPFQPRIECTFSTCNILSSTKEAYLDHLKTHHKVQVVEGTVHELGIWISPYQNGTPAAPTQFVSTIIKCFEERYFTLSVSKEGTKCQIWMSHVGDKDATAQKYGFFLSIKNTSKAHDQEDEGGHNKKEVDFHGTVCPLNEFDDGASQIEINSLVFEDISPYLTMKDNGDQYLVVHAYILKLEEKPLGSPRLLTIPEETDEEETEDENEFVQASDGDISDMEDMDKESQMEKAPKEQDGPEVGINRYVDNNENQLRNVASNQNIYQKSIQIINAIIPYSEITLFVTFCILIAIFSVLIYFKSN